MDQYFEWYEMTKERKCKFAKLRLVHQARLYWGNVECIIRQRGHIPIATWKAMKIKLREKYLPMSYEQWRPITHRLEPNRISTLGYKPSTSHVLLSRPTPTTPFVHKDGMEEEIYMADLELVD